MPILVLGDKRLEYKLRQWTNRDGIALQEATGLKWGEFVDHINANDGDLLTATALVWMVRRKNGEPGLKFSDVEFSFEDFDIDLDDEQQQALAEAQAAAAAAGEPKPDPTQGGSRRSPRPRQSRGSGPKVSSS